MPRRDAGQLAYGQRGDDERGEADHDGGRDREIGVPVAEGVTHRADADREVAPVLDRVERPVERDEEAEVEDLDQDQHTEQRPDHPGHEAPDPRRQGDGEAEDDESLEREPHEGARGEEPRPDREDEREPDDRQGEHREHGGRDRVPDAARGKLRRAPRPGAATATRRRGRTTRRAGRGRRPAGRGSRRAAEPRRPRSRARPPAPPSPSCASRAAAAAPATTGTPSRPRGTRSARARSGAPSRRPSGRPRC